MPSKTPKQAKFMRAIAHGWTPSRAKNPPSRAVAQEFVNADRKYSGGFAENRYAKGGLSAMGEVDAGSERQRPLQQLGNWQEGGDVDYRVPGEHGVYEAPNVEEMGPALEQMFSDMEATRKGKEREVIDYTWDKTQSREAETALDERLEAMSGPEQVAYVKPRLLAAMQEMKTIGESEKFKQYSIKDYWLSTDQVSLWRGKWSKALQQQAREAGTEEEGMQRGGRAGRRRNGGGGAGALPTVAPPPAPPPAPSPWGTEAGTTQQMLDRMGYSGPMGYIGVVSGLRQAGWTAAPGGNDGDLRNTMWYPPESTLTGGGGPGGPSEPPPRIIPTDPASYVGGTASGTSGSGGGGGGSSGEGSEYRKDLRKHQRRIENILGSARGGHVNYYEEGGAVRPGHAEGPNPYEGKGMPNAYKQWERKHHIDPPPPPEAAATTEPEDIPWYKKLAGYGTPTKADEALTEMEQAYGGRVGYQLGGLAIAAPAGGVPPWISPTGSGPGYMDEPPPGYQFGGIADRFNPPAAAPAAAPVGMAAPQAGISNRAQQARGRLGPSRGGRFGRAGPQRGMTSRGAQPGGLAAMQQQAQQQQAGFAGRLPPGIDPRAVAANPEGYRAQVEAQRAGAQRGFQGMAARGEMGPGTSRQYNMSTDQYRGATDAQRRAAEMMGGEQPGGGQFGEMLGREESMADRIARAQRMATGQQTYADVVASGRGGINPMQDDGMRLYDPARQEQMGEGRVQAGGGMYSDPRHPAYTPPGSGGSFNMEGRYTPPTTGFLAGHDPTGGKRFGRRIAPPPGKDMGGSGPFNPGPVGGPRVPPNQRGYLQKQRMMNRPPANVGGGANRVGMADQQGALSRAMQRGTGRPPMSRRSGFGRAR